MKVKVVLTYDASSKDYNILGVAVSLLEAEKGASQNPSRGTHIDVDYGLTGKVAVVTIDAPNGGILEERVRQYVGLSSVEGATPSYVRPVGHEAYAATADALKSLGLGLENPGFFDLKRWSGHKKVRVMPVIMPLESLATS